MRRNQSWMVYWAVGGLLLGCSRVAPPGGPRVKTYPVTGQVHVDGAPKQGVGVKFHPQPNAAAISFQVAANSSSDGKLVVTTYSPGDGLPEGTYKLTFEMSEEDPNASQNAMRRTEDAESHDLFKGAYADPMKSKFEVTVAKDSKNDFGVFELTTKGD